jgi:hypothetical protein
MAVIHTLKTIRDQVLAMLDEAGATGNVVTNINNAINHAHQLRLMTESWPFMLWDSVETFSLVANQQQYILHPEVASLYYLYNQTAKRYLQEIPSRQLEPLQINHNADQGAEYFMIRGRSPVKAQPSAATTLRVVSTSGVDTSAMGVTIRGVDANDEVVSESFSMNGTSQVTGSTSFVKILRVTKSGSFGGTLTVSTSGGTTLLSLGTSEWGKSYPTIQLLQLPSQTDTIEYQFYRQPQPLTDDYDMVDIPPPFGQVLVYDALSHIAQYATDLKASSVSFWADERAAWDTAMRQTYLEGQTIGAMPRFTRDLDDTSPYPRVWR